MALLILVIIIVVVVMLLKKVIETIEIEGQFAFDELCTVQTGCAMEESCQREGAFGAVCSDGRSGDSV